MANRNTITINFNADENHLYEDFDQEAKEKGTNRSDYAKKIILNHDNRKKVVLEGGLDNLRRTYEAKIELLKETNAELQNRLLDISANQRQLQGLETPQPVQPSLSVDEQVQRGIDRYVQQVEKDRLIKENTELTAQVDKLTARVEQLEEEVEDLEDQVETKNEKLGYVELAKDVGPQLLSGLAKAFPSKAGNIVDAVSRGLGAFGGQGIGQGMDETSQRQLEIGRKIDTHFNQDELPKVDRLIDFFSQHKNLIDQNLQIIEQYLGSR